MPITISTPIEQNGAIYPYYMINLAISPIEKEHVGGSVSLRLVPYREKTEAEGGGFERLEDQAKSVVFLDVFEQIGAGDVALANAVGSIMGAIQQFINDKNL